MSDLVIWLWNLTLSILSAMGDVWVWLTTQHEIGKLEIFGTTIIEGLSITPLAFGGAVMLLILGLGLISLLNPFN